MTGEINKKQWLNNHRTMVTVITEILRECIYMGIE